MRFTLTQLLLVVPAFCVSLLLVDLWDARTNGKNLFIDKWQDAENQVLRLALRVEKLRQMARTSTGSDISVDFVNLWLTGGVSATHPTASKFYASPPGVDPWDRDYRCAALPGSDPAYGIYSLGEDGLSDSSGNDPDDVNSWDQKTYDWYTGDRLTRRRMRLMFWGVLWTPVVVVGMHFGIQRLLGRARRQRTAAISA